MLRSSLEERKRVNAAATQEMKEEKARRVDSTKDRSVTLTSSVTSNTSKSITSNSHPSNPSSTNSSSISPCCFCSSTVDRRNGEYGVTWIGPIPVDPPLPSQIFAHATCAKWNHEVQLGPDGESFDMKDVVKAVKRIPTAICKVCAKPGGQYFTQT